MSPVWQLALVASWLGAPLPGCVQMAAVGRACSYTCPPNGDPPDMHPMALFGGLHGGVGLCWSVPPSLCVRRPGSSSAPQKTWTSFWAFFFEYFHHSKICTIKSSILISLEAPQWHEVHPQCCTAAPPSGSMTLDLVKLKLWPRNPKSSVPGPHRLLAVAGNLMTPGTACEPGHSAFASL